MVVVGQEWVVAMEQTVSKHPHHIETRYHQRQGGQKVLVDVGQGVLWHLGEFDVEEAEHHS